MAVTYDFTLVASGVPGLSLVMAQNEDAFSFITDEADMTTIADGSAPLDNSRLSDFIDIAERAQMCCDFA